MQFRSQFQGSKFSMTEAVRDHLRKSRNPDYLDALKSLAPSTRAHYRCYIRRLDRWIREQGAESGEEAKTLDARLLARFMRHLFREEGKAPRSIDQFLHAARHRAKALGMAPLEGPAIDQARRELRREGRTVARVRARV